MMYQLATTLGLILTKLDWFPFSGYGEMGRRTERLTRFQNRHMESCRHTKKFMSKLKIWSYQSIAIRIPGWQGCIIQAIRTSSWWSQVHNTLNGSEYQWQIICILKFIWIQKRKQASSNCSFALSDDNVWTYRKKRLSVTVFVMSREYLSSFMEGARSTTPAKE